MKNRKFVWIIIFFAILLSIPTSAKGLENSAVDLQKITDRISSLNKSAEEYKVQGDYKNAVKNYLDAVNLIQDTEQALGNNRLLDQYEITSRTGLGSCYYYLEEYDSGLKAMEGINTQTSYWDYDVSSTVKSQYYLVYGNILTKLKQFNEADNLYARLNEIYGNSVNKSSVPGINFFNSKEYGKAVDALQKDLLNTPLNISLYSYLAKSYCMLQQYDKALKIYDFLIKDHLLLVENVHMLDELTEDDLDAYYGYGRQQREAGNLKKALEILNSAAERIKAFEVPGKPANLMINKQKANLYFELGYAYYLQKEYQKSLEAFSVVEEIVNPQKNYPPNLLIFDVTKEISSKEASNYYYFYAVCHEMLGNMDKAHLYYTEANKYFKRYPDELFLKGKKAYMENDFLKAVEFFKASLNERPQNMEAYYYMAKSYFAVSDKEMAEKTADLIIKKGLTDVNSIYAFKSVIKQSDLNYKAAASIEDKLRKDFRRKVILISLVILLLSSIAITTHVIRGRKVKYATALEELYGDIEKLRTDKALSNESKAEVTGLEF